jgi:hypothetical protein
VQVKQDQQDLLDLKDLLVLLDPKVMLAWHPLQQI